MDKKEIKAVFSDFERKVIQNSIHHCGYPMNLKKSFAEVFESFDFALPLNNIGDPLRSTSSSDRFFFEREVVEFFADLYHLPISDARGYVTTGGSEGNLYGLYLARELYPEGVLLFSEDSHYSIPKYGRLLRMNFEAVPSLETGEINYEELEKKIKSICPSPIILNLNIGTTMKGAVDDVQKVLEVLKKCEVSNFYIHCDAALFGVMLPFLNEDKMPTFRQEIGSISISGHKFIGAPTPCGVVLAKDAYVKQIESDPEYTRSIDSTILGSRSGHNPVLLWYAIRSRGPKQFKKEADLCIQNAKYLESQLNDIGYTSFRNPDSNIVVFPKPSFEIIKKWKLASHGEDAHAVVMPHVSTDKINQLVSEIKDSTV